MKLLRLIGLLTAAVVVAIPLVVADASVRHTTAMAWPWPNGCPNGTVCFYRQGNGGDFCMDSYGDAADLGPCDNIGPSGSIYNNGVGCPGCQDVDLYWGPNYTGAYYCLPMGHYLLYIENNTFDRGPGLPAPTGNVSVRINGYYTPVVALAAGGSVTFQATLPSLAPPSVLGPLPIRIWYYGDPEYAASGADFPLTNGSLSSGTSAPSVGAAASAQAPGLDPPTISGSATAETTAGSPTPEAQLAQPSGPSTSASRAAVSPRLVADAARGRPWVGALVLVTLIGLGGGLAWLRRRRSARIPLETDG